MFRVTNNHTSPTLITPYKLNLFLHEAIFAIDWNSNSSQHTHLANWLVQSPTKSLHHPYNTNQIPHHPHPWWQVHDKDQFPTSPHHYQHHVLSNTMYYHNSIIRLQWESTLTQDILILNNSANKNPYWINFPISISSHKQTISITTPITPHVHGHKNKHAHTHSSIHLHTHQSQNTKHKNKNKTTHIMPSQA